jgi:hypothetical protein
LLLTSNVRLSGPEGFEGLGVEVFFATGFFVGTASRAVGDGTGVAGGEVEIGVTLGKAGIDVTFGKTGAVETGVTGASTPGCGAGVIGGPEEPALANAKRPKTTRHASTIQSTMLRRDLIDAPQYAQ